MASFVNSSIFSTLAGLTSLLAGFVCNVIIARTLGPDGSGIVAFGVWAALTAYTIANFGIPNTLQRYMLRYDQPGNCGGGLARHLLPRFLIPMTIATFGLLAYVYFFPGEASADVYSPEIFLIITLVFLFYSIACYAEGSSRGLHRSPEITRFAVIGSALQIPAVVAGSLLFGAAGALAGYAVRHLPQALAVRRYIASTPETGTRFDSNIYSYARNTWFTGMLGTIAWGRTEYLFLSFYVSPVELGFYAAGLSLAALVTQLPGHMLAALTTHLGELHDQGSTERIEKTYQRTMRWIGLSTLPICLGGAAVMSELLPMIFGDAFDGGRVVAAILVGSAFLNTLEMVPRAVMMARERSHVIVRISAVFAVLSIAVFAVVVPYAGLIGAAVARIALHGLLLSVLMIYCGRQLNLAVGIRWLLGSFAAAALCAVTAYAVLWSIGGITGLLVAVPAGALVYFAAVRALNCIPQEDADVLLWTLSAVLPKRLTPLLKAVFRVLVRQERSTK
ncbi:lipopolysaccharide biosynthesis protein [Roseibium sp.]|uniref:lipopolysaccharide biosynthesis protein n=1 Tax=Roseibium sp. TaxID=1936156 RepID=UPI0032656CD5